MSDLLPPTLRYGRLRSITRLFVRRPLPVVTDTELRGGKDWARPERVSDGPRVALVTGTLDMGGVENVVRMLAEGLGAEGLATSVLCSGGGATLDAIAESGVDVAVAYTLSEGKAALLRLAPDVIEVHNAPPVLLQAVRDSGTPWVSVIHNAEIHRGPEAWAELADAALARWIAVSEGARDFHLSHVPGADHDTVVVVPNASPAVPATYDPASRSGARRAVETATGWTLSDDDVLVVSLSRYDPQKNVPGLIAGFDKAAGARPALRLVVAGPPVDPLEVLRAKALRRASRRPDAVALLGPSSSSLILAAADAFVLDSFFEGWPIAVIEAIQAGLPVIISDVGVARDLLDDGSRGVLLPNPATEGTIDERAVRAARRHPRSQRNAPELCDALVDMADRAVDWRGRRESLALSATELFTLEDMVKGHAYWLKDALDRAGGS